VTSGNQKIVPQTIICARPQKIFQVGQNLFFPTFLSSLAKISFAYYFSTSIQEFPMCKIKPCFTYGQNWLIAINQCKIVGNDVGYVPTKGIGGVRGINPSVK